MLLQMFCCGLCSNSSQETLYWEGGGGAETEWKVITRMFMSCCWLAMCLPFPGFGFHSFDRHNFHNFFKPTTWEIFMIVLEENFTGYIFLRIFWMKIATIKCGSSLISLYKFYWDNMNFMLRYFDLLTILCSFFF